MPTAVHVDLQFLARLFTGWYPCKPLLVILGFKYFPIIKLLYERMAAIPCLQDTQFYDHIRHRTSDGPKVKNKIDSRQSTAKDHIRAKQNVFLPQVKILIY